MRKYLAAVLAVPILLLVYTGALIRRPSSRLPISLIVVAMVTALAAAAVRPTPTTGIAPTHRTALDAAELTTTIQTGQSPRAAVVVNFPGPMNGASVEALMTVEPPTPITVAWDQSMTSLTVTPESSWASSALNTISVAAGALEADGQPIAQPVRAAFVTRDATTAVLGADALVGGKAASGTRFRITFSAPVDPATIAVEVTPRLPGTLLKLPNSDPLAPTFEFIPADGLAADTEYTVALGPTARDLDGTLVVASPLVVGTAGSPSVVRFRPLGGASSVTWSQNLSVRFTEPMDHASTQAAWSATQAGAPVPGAFTWAESDTVLIFNPKANLGYGQKVTMSVGVGARSKAGVPVAAPVSASFTTAPKPASSGSRSGSGSTTTTTIGGSTWAAVESYYLKLMNCTRTGGWVTSTGACSSPGGRAVAPLWQDAGITAKVSRPYAKKLAVNNLCTHFSGGNPGNRLSAAGYKSYVWAENLGCRSGNPYSAVLASHLYFQSEKSYSGGHYVNLMNAKYDRVGIGVWVSSGRVRLVIDFYHPL